jgi:hypothetical protein
VILASWPSSSNRHDLGRNRGHPAGLPGASNCRQRLSTGREDTKGTGVSPITGFAFLGVTAYVHISGVNYKWSGGLFAGLFCSALGMLAVSLLLPGIGAFSYLLLGIVGILGVVQILYGTSKVLKTPNSTTPSRVR